MERPEQLANAYEHVARVNHYMVGIVEPTTYDELCVAQQIMIERQNRLSPNHAAHRDLELALDLIEQDIKHAANDEPSDRIAAIVAKYR